VPVVTRWPGELRRGTDFLTTLHIPTSASAHVESPQGVPLSSLARIELVPVASGVYRRNGERVNEVQGYLAPYEIPSRALSAFRQRLADSDLLLPPGYRLEFGGEEEGSGQAQGQLAGVLAPLLLAVFGVLVLAFNSFRLTLLIWLVAIASIGFALGTLWLFHQPFGFMAAIGCMGLIGLAINDSVVMLAGIRADPEAARGTPDALVRVALSETRHILSTTITTIGGFTPLILWGGNMWPPLALVLAGGLVGGAVLSLLMVPCAYLWMTRSRRLPLPLTAAGTTNAA